MKKPCPPQSHNRLSAFYDGRVETIEQNRYREMQKCSVCGAVFFQEYARPWLSGFDEIKPAGVNGTCRVDERLLHSGWGDDE